MKSQDAEELTDGEKDGSKPVMMDLLRSKIKFRIYTLFEIYRSLTLQEIADHLNRSKSSIHPHVHALIELGIVQPPSKFDSQRNFILELTPDYTEKLRYLDRDLDFSQGITRDLLDRFSAASIEIIANFQALFEEQIQFSKKMIRKNADPAKFEEVKASYERMIHFEYDPSGNLLLDENGIPRHHSQNSNSFMYLDPGTFEAFRNEYVSLINKYDRIMEEKSEQDPNCRHSVCFFSHSMPLQLILEENIKKNPSE